MKIPCRQDYGNEIYPLLNIDVYLLLGIFLITLLLVQLIEVSFNLVVLWRLLCATSSVQKTA